MKLILASGSPRRRELLARLGLPFEVVTRPVTELTTAAEVRTLPVENARRKAAAVAMEFPSATVLGADTVVVFDGAVIGKPADLPDARRILRLLSGKTHEVLTGLALFHPGVPEPETWLVSTSVRFKPYDDSTVSRYLELVPVLDKAGAYGIQEHGDMLVDSYGGELENVIGLPLKQLRERLSI